MNRKMNEAQVKHYLLSYNDSTLIYWYNNVIISPWQDYSEQAIRDNTEDEQGTFLVELSLEVIVNASKHKLSNYSSDDRYFALTGGENPYIVSFSTFAGNPYFISPEKLTEDGLLTEEECNRAENL